MSGRMGDQVDEVGTGVASAVVASSVGTGLICSKGKKDVVFVVSVGPVDSGGTPTAGLGAREDHSTGLTWSVPSGGVYAQSTHMTSILMSIGGDADPTEPDI